MKQPKYGDLPIDLGEFKIPFNENHFTLYMPIKMAGSFDIRIPDVLLPFNQLVKTVYRRILNSTSTQELQDFWLNRYLYLTVKHMLVHPDFWGNRGGEHADGYGTDDINWVWLDKNPTEYCYADFDIPEGTDDKTALNMFRDQWDYKKQVTYPENHLLEISPYVVHRVARVTRYDMRTFVKISLSRHQFNLTGNAHNHLFDYKWEMFDRQAVRNMENYSNMDYTPGDIA